MLNIKFLVMRSPMPQRRENVEAMKKQIPNLVVKDCQEPGLFEQAIECWQLEDEYDGIVILEDDVQLCENFMERIMTAIEERPDESISFFESACSKKPLHSEYRPGSKLMWMQCRYYPAKIAKLLCKQEEYEYFKENWRKYTTAWSYPIDTYASVVFRRHKLKYFMKLPFLVQHLPIRSAVGNRPTNRQTKFFIDDVGEDYV